MLKDILSAPGKLLNTQTPHLSRAGRFAVLQIKMWTHCARLLRMNRAGQQAAALAYHTVFGLVPLAIVVLLTIQLFPAHQDIVDKIKSLTYEQVHLVNVEVPDPESTESKILLSDYLDDVVGTFFKGVHTGSITIVSVVVVIWAALSLLSTVERAFNNIWHVARGRNVVHRVISYWALLTLGPLLIFVSVYVSMQYAIAGFIDPGILSGDGEGGFVAFVAPVLTSYFLATVGFFMLYFILPNTKVHAKAAIWGAAVAALVWVIAKNIFGYYVTVWNPYSTVYGIMAIVPITVLAIYITWLIVLFGLQLTFTTQHLTSLDAAEIASARKTESNFIANDLTIINILREIASSFETGDAPISAEAICSRLNVPAEFGAKILNHLTDSKLVVRTSEPRVGYLPARDPGNIALVEVTDVVSSAAFAQTCGDEDQMLSRINLARKNAVGDCTLKQILPEQEAGGGSDSTV